MDDQLYEVQRVMGLLAYPANTTLAPYRVSRSWNAIISFNAKNERSKTLKSLVVFIIEKEKLTKKCMSIAV